MGDLSEYWELGRISQLKRHQNRREENVKFLEENNIGWHWVDKTCDHILINGMVDYYLGKTYYFNRKTKKRGYRMLNKLFKGEKV